MGTPSRWFGERGLKTADDIDQEMRHHMRTALAAITTLSAGAVLGMAVATAAPTPAVPDADALTSQLQRVLSTSTPAAERAAALQGGQAAIPTADNIAGQLDRYKSMFSWRVQNPELHGDQLDAQLAVSVPILGTRTHDIYWVNDGGTWKLSNASACVIATQVAGTNCTV